MWFERLRFAETYAGEGGRESLIGQPYAELLRRAVVANRLFDGPDDLDDWLAERMTMHRAADNRPDRFRIAPDTWLQARSRRTAQGDLVTVQSDISELKRKKQELEQSRSEARFQALHDPLTGLPNRILLQSHLEQMLHQADRGDQVLALLYIDLDRFKAVNDRLRHQAGDQCLNQVAVRIAGCHRSCEPVARIGGDEFALPLLVSTPDPRGQVEQVAQRILQQLARPLAIRGLSARIGASIGIALYPQDADGLETLVGHADHAMYAAKAEPGDCFRFFSDL